jgi:uncharacterized protein YegJ (DUF2314 family)
MSDPTVSFADQDQRMAFAIDEARRSLNVFFDAFCSPKRNQTAFLLKVRFEVPEKIEHIWLADIDASVMPLEGTVANEPNFPGLEFMQRVEFYPSAITDWMFIEDGYLVGGFTTQVIRSRMSPEERASFDANAPYRFRD